MKLPHNQALCTPWRQGNEFALLRDGDQYFPAMLEAIRQAQHYILLEMYLMESGGIANDFIQALHEAADRGVLIYCILDDLGSQLLSVADRQRLQRNGLHLLIYNPLRWRKFLGNVYRDHRKQLNIDGRLCFTGGLGISDLFSPRLKGGEAWRDTVIRIEGPVVLDWQAAFVHNWKHWTEQEPKLPPAQAEQQEEDMAGRLVMTGGGQRLEIKRSLIHEVRNARQRIWITTAYFMPSRKLRRELRKADRRGVDVRLLLPGRKTDHPSVRYAGRRLYHRLLRNGVRIFEYQPRFIHAKQAICDDWISVGSANYDRWSLRWSLEANQEVRDPSMAHQARELFLQDLEQSEEILLQEWVRRPWRQKLRERFWGLVDRLVEFLHHRRKLERRNPFRRGGRK